MNLLLIVTEIIFYKLIVYNDIGRVIVYKSDFGNFKHEKKCVMQLLDFSNIMISAIPFTRIREIREKLQRINSKNILQNALMIFNEYNIFKL